MNSVNLPNAPDQFEAHRPLMFSIAYRMLGSAMEAEDIVQEAYLRYQGVSPETIRSPKAFLSTVVTRLCLNQLESARAKREEYIGPWLPEPVLTEAGEVTALNALLQSPSQQAELHESISLAFLVLLEQLTPVERAVFLLREVFDYEYAEIAEILDKDEVACRQLLSRAKKHIAEHRPRFKATPEQHRQLLNQFMRAVGTGELDGLMTLLSDDVTMWADGGGKARGAATQPLHGRTAVAQFALSSTRFLPPNYHAEIAEVNGQPAAILRVGDKAVAIIAIEVDSDHIRAVRVIGNPDKLKWV
jgi:RNA polymerase sigma-70 factor (ECF subfamily)